MEIILGIATILGGFAAIWYFFEKFSQNKTTSKSIGLEKPMHSKDNPLKLLIVEDEGRFRVNLKNMFEEYQGVFEVKLAADAGEALDYLNNEQFNVLVLDIMMPYGSAIKELDGDSDPSMSDAGYRLLKVLKKSDAHKNNELFVAVVTARAEPTILRKINDLINENGKIYLKPFDDFAFENDICERFRIKSKVPKVFK